MGEQLMLRFDDVAAIVDGETPKAIPDPVDRLLDRDRLPQLITSGTIAAELNEPPRRVLRVLATRRDIRPVALAGRTRLYPAAAVARVRHELTAIDARQCREAAR
jgi:hypothetical protein